MYYMLKERLDIGRKVFTHELSREAAVKEYDVSAQTIINYVKECMR